MARDQDGDLEEGLPPPLQPPSSSERSLPWHGHIRRESQSRGSRGSSAKPRLCQEQAVSYFFQNAVGASAKNQPLRFHMSQGRNIVYGMIVTQDMQRQQDSAGRYVLFMPDRAAARDVVAELAGAFPELRSVVVGDDDECGGIGWFNLWVCDYAFAGCLNGQNFRIKIVEEGVQFQRGTPIYEEIRRGVKGELVVHFAGKSVTDGEGADETVKPPKMEEDASWTSWFTKPYNMMWKAIIRPPRAQYSQNDLGIAKFVFGSCVFERKDLQLTSYQGHSLECSHFAMLGSDNNRFCVVYLHGNCSSRLEVFYVLPTLLSRGFSVFCLDMSGSGWSGGEYISLGYHEEQDVKTVLAYLRDSGAANAVGIWGRSMGAAAAVLRAGKDHDIAAVVLDSAFSDLGCVVDEYVSRMKIRIPEFVLSVCVSRLRSEVQSRAGFDPYEVAPLDSARKALCPALFGVAMDDCFILPHHTMDLHNVWAGERVLSQFYGGHSGRRPTWFLDQAADFLLDRLTAAATATADGLRPLSGRVRRRTYAL